jgi:hypothetical protein
MQNRSWKTIIRGSRNVKERRKQPRTAGEGPCYPIPGTSLYVDPIDRLGHTGVKQYGRMLVSESQPSRAPLCYSDDSPGSVG